MCVAPQSGLPSDGRRAIENESLQPQLEEAQRVLETALEEACAVDLSDVDTGELIRIEETLHTASQAAKQAVSMRLRLRSQRERTRERTRGQEPATEPRANDRIFDDIRGKRWHVYAVHPSTPSVERAALPESFRQGWLTFEAADEMRRVAPIPENWQDFSTEDLRLMCHKAASAPKRINAIDPSKPRDSGS